MHTRIFLALLIVCGTARASGWVSIGKSQDGTTEWFVDTSSIKISKTIRRAWIKTVFVPHTYKDIILQSGKWLDHNIERDVFNCNDETVGMEAITVYYEDGLNSTPPWDSKAARMEPIPPDTAQMGELKFICAWKLK
jgi:hypothetical protein